MHRYIYISCLEDERELPEVVGLCQRIASNGGVAVFPGWAGYTFKQYAAFVAVVGYGYNNASWLNGELYDAYNRSNSHPDHLPLIFGLSIEGAGLPRCSQHFPINWLDTEQSYTRLLLGMEGEPPVP